MSSQSDRKPLSRSNSSRMLLLKGHVRTTCIYSENGCEGVDDSSDVGRGLSSDVKKSGGLDDVTPAGLDSSPDDCPVASSTARVVPVPV